MDDTDSSLQFSEDDIRQQLDLLGYHNVPTSQLRQFAQDLEQLIRRDTERQTSSGFWISSDSDVDADDLKIPVQSRQLDAGSSIAGRRPASAPYSSRRKSPTKKRSQPTGPGRSKNPSHPARHPQPFSYKYNDASTAELHDSDVTLPGREGQERRRSSEKPAMKRKVVRKMNGHVRVFDESVTDSELGDHQDMTNRLSRLALGQDVQGIINEGADSTLTETDDASSLMSLVYTGRRPQSSRELYTHRPAGDENTVYKPHLPRSFIRPDTAKPRMKHDERTDPVTRHQMYRTEWKSHRAPGEKSRKDLRWNIREQMMYKDMTYPQRKPRVYSANNYVVPTDKKRQALRWAVRTSLAHKQMPASTYY